MRIFVGLTALAAAMVASPSRAATMIIGTTTAGGYTFTNFDFAPLTSPAAGSNVNGISNSDQVTGTTVDVNNASTFTNFSGNSLTGTLTQLNTGAGQVAFGINSAGNVVGGNNTNAFHLPNGGSLQNLTAPPNATERPPAGSRWVRQSAESPTKNREAQKLATPRQPKGFFKQPPAFRLVTPRNKAPMTSMLLPTYWKWSPGRRGILDPRNGH
jgi:uncharacterized membrane protein